MTLALRQDVVSIARAELRNPSYLPALTLYRRFRHLLSRSLGRTLRRPNYRYFWTTAILADGLAEHYNATYDIEVLETLKRYHFDSRRRQEFRTPRYVDEAMNANSLIDIRNTLAPTETDDILTKFAVFLKEHPRTEDGVLPYRTNHPDRVLIDTIGMICPFLIKYSVAFNDSASLNLSVNQILDYFKRGFCEASGLPHHGYNARTQQVLGGEGWGRGVGWFMIGLSSTILHLPASHSHFSYLLRRYKELNKIAFSKQRTDGSFPEHLLDPNSLSDTSATSMIAYSTTKMIERELISRDQLNACTKAYDFILSSVDSTGRIQNCSGEALGANKYATSFGWFPWAQGPAIGLGATLHRMQQRRAE